MKVGLVLEGGGMRGLYTAGVLDVMMDHHFMPDVVCGTSAGVTFGVNLLSQQRGRVLRYNCRYIGERRYISLHSWLTTGNMINKDFAYDLLPRELDPFDEATYEQSSAEFYATITNMRTGEAEYVRITDTWKQMDVIRASASLPIICQPVEWNGEKYLDGGLADNIPLDKCLELGCDKVIIVLTRPMDYVRNDHIAPLCRLAFPRYKALLRTIDRRNEKYNARIQQILELEKQGKVFVIRPSENRPVSRLEKDPEKLKALHALGLHDTMQQWQALEAYLGK
jgi:predicted patatin/cPLA2 family phospholipase